MRQLLFVTLTLMKQVLTASIYLSYRFLRIVLRQIWGLAYGENLHLAIKHVQKVIKGLLLTRRHQVMIVLT